MVDPDLEIRGRGVSKNFFWPFGPQIGQKIRGGEVVPPGSPPGFATAVVSLSSTTEISYVDYKPILSPLSPITRVFV